MTEPIRRGDQWWDRASDGTWRRWNTATSTWDLSSLGPPPPPGPPSPTSWPTPGDDAVRGRKLLVIAAILTGILAVVVVGWTFQGGISSDSTLVAPTVPGPEPAPAGEPTIYESAPLLASRCLGNASESVGAVAREGIPDDFNPRLKDIAATVAAYRDLRFRKPVKTVLTSPRQISQLAMKTIKSDPHSRIEEHVLKTLGAIPRNMDLTATVRDALGDDILGFYKPKVKTIHSPRLSGGNDPLAEITLAHELEHALMDQHEGLPLMSKASPLRADAVLAARAVIEGDATLITQDYLFFELDSADRVKLGTDLAIQGGSASGLPYFLQQAFAFPYNEGALFACYLYAKGGWEAVNQAYSDPPRATSEVLFPDRYGDKAPLADVPDPRVPSGWKRTARMSVGAADLLWLFNAPLGRVKSDSDALDRVRSWNGGEIHVYQHDQVVGFVMSLAGTDAHDAASGPATLCNDTLTWLTDSWGNGEKKDGTDTFRQDGGYVLMRCRPFGPKVAFAPNISSARALLGRASP